MLSAFKNLFLDLKIKRKFAKTPLKKHCTLYEYKLLERHSPWIYRDVLEGVGVSGANYYNFMSYTDASWIIRAMEQLDLSDVDVDCFIAYVEYLKIF